VDLSPQGDAEVDCLDAAPVLGNRGEPGNRVNIVILDARGDNPFSSSFRSTDRRAELCAQLLKLVLTRVGKHGSEVARGTASLYKEPQSRPLSGDACGGDTYAEYRPGWTGVDGVTNDRNYRPARTCCPVCQRRWLENRLSAHYWP